MSMKEPQTFVWKYCLTAELLIIKYSRLSITVSSMALLTAVTGPEGSVVVLTQYM